jgi:predicted RND superfamily exporter protein
MDKFFKRPWVIVGVIVAITVFFALQLPGIKLDNNVASFLPNNHPAKIISKHFEEEYGDSIIIMVGLERPYGTVFDAKLLRQVREFSGALEFMPLVKSVNSIMSTQYITSDNESIIITDLVAEDFSGTPEEIAELRRRINSWDMYQGSLVSDDLSSTQIMVRLNATVDHAGDPEIVALLMEIQGLAKERFAGLAEVYVAGESMVSATLTTSMLADMGLLIPLVIVTLLGILILSFRHFTYVTLPLLTVVVSAIVSVGSMPLLGVHLSVIVVIMPVILIGVGSAYGIHLISHYKDEISGRTFTVDEHKEFVFSLLRRLVKPVFLAALTTFAGFISFYFAPLGVLRDFGLFTAAGVLIAFATALTLIPALLLIRGPHAVKTAKQKKHETIRAKKIVPVETALATALVGIVRKKTLVFAVTALVIGISIAGTSRVVVENSMIEFLNPASDMRRSDRFIRERFGGASQFIVSVEADSTAILLHPDTLMAADNLCTYLRGRVPHVGKVTGFTDMIKRMNQMFNVDESADGIQKVIHAAYPDDSTEDSFGFGEFDFEETGEDSWDLSGEVLQSGFQDLSPPATSETPITFAMLNAAIGKSPAMSAHELARELERMANYEGYAYYEIPSDPARYGKETREELGQLVANYLVLLAGDADESMANDPLEPTAFEIMVIVDSQWQEDTVRIIDEINRYVAANFPENVRVLVGGGATQEMALAGLVMNSQVVSVIIAVIAVLIIIAFSNKSFIAGLIAALPLSIAILFVFAMMGLFGITLNMATAMIASLAVGIGIDYTIHFMESYKREFQNGGDYLHRTFATSGKAILINAVSVGAGFAVFGLSQFPIIKQFGALICFSMVINAVVSLTVIPVFLETLKPKFIYGEKK